MFKGLLEENGQLSVTGDHQSEGTGSESRAMIIIKLLKN